MADEKPAEHGHKWWIRYVGVPLIAALGGLIILADRLGSKSQAEPPPAAAQSSPLQIQTGPNGMQAGRDVVINNHDGSGRDDGTFLYEEKLEGVYWNEWWAHPLRSRETTRKYGQAELTITGEGKTVDFSGVISMNCENGKYFWKAAVNFQSVLTTDDQVGEVVPDQIHRNVYKLFCRER